MSDERVRNLERAEAAGNRRASAVLLGVLRSLGRCGGRDPIMNPQPGDVVEWVSMAQDGRPHRIEVLGRRSPSEPTTAARYGGGQVVEVLVDGGETDWMMHEWVAQRQRAAVLERGPTVGCEAGHDFPVGVSFVTWSFQNVRRCSRCEAEEIVPRGTS